MDTARILPLNACFFFLLFFNGTISVREILLRVEKLRPDRLKRTEHGKNTVKIFFICTVVRNINRDVIFPYK